MRTKARSNKNGIVVLYYQLVGFLASFLSPGWLLTGSLPLAGSLSLAGWFLSGSLPLAGSLSLAD